MLLGPALLLAGCTSFDADGPRRSSIHLGVVAITRPATAGAVSAVDVTTIGAGWDRGPFLGYQSGKWIVADPAKCQLLIVIREDVQAANAAQIIRSLEGQNPCIVDFTNTLPH